VGQASSRAAVAVRKDCLVQSLELEAWRNR